jgi:hypothetical protein
VLTNTRPDSASSANGFSDGLLFKEGTVFRCSSGPDDLPGLKAWTLTAMSSGEEMKWSIDLSEYQRSRVESPNPAVESIRKARASTRHKVSNLLILLIKSTESMLLGQQAIGDTREFEGLWQRAHEQILKSYDSSKLSAEVSLLLTYSLTHSLTYLLTCLHRWFVVGTPTQYVRSLIHYAK